MKCVFCRSGETRCELVTVERRNQAGEPTAVIHNFPAEVCQLCGEEYYSATDWRNAESILARSPVRVAEVPVYDLGAS